VNFAACLFNINRQRNCATPLKAATRLSRILNVCGQTASATAWRSFYVTSLFLLRYVAYSFSENIGATWRAWRDWLPRARSGGSPLIWRAATCATDLTGGGRASSLSACRYRLRTLITTVNSSTIAWAGFPSFINTFRGGWLRRARQGGNTAGR